MMAILWQGDIEIIETKYYGFQKTRNDFDINIYIYIYIYSA